MPLRASFPITFIKDVWLFGGSGHVVGHNVNQAQDHESEAIRAWMLSFAGDTKKLPALPPIFEDRLTSKVWDNEQFQRCLHMKKGTLFLHGAPGVGKTTTAAGIVHRLLERQPEITVACRFFEFREEPSQHSADKIAMRLLLQVCGETGIFPDCVCELYKVRGARDPTLETITTALVSVIQQNKKGCVIVLDAMDECRDRPALDNLLEALFKVQEHTGIGIIATDRRKDLRSIAFAIPELLELHSISEDMRAYVMRRLKSNGSLLQDGDEGEHKLYLEACNSILDGSEGLFLLVELNTEYMMSADSEREVEVSIKAIRAMTSELCGSDQDDFREKVLDRAFGRNIERLFDPHSKRNTKRAKLILCFVRDAQRTLTIAELRHALDSLKRENDFEQVKDIKFPAASFCMGLIQVDQDQKVQFLHGKLREYLRSHYLEQLPRCDFELGKSCLKYISMNIFSSGWCEDSQSLANRQSSFPFVGYASKYWATHLMLYLRESQRQSQVPDQASFEPLALSFLRNAAKVQASWQMCKLKGQPLLTVSTSSNSGLRLSITIETKKREIADYKPLKFSGLHLLCNFGFHSLLTPLIKVLELDSLNDEDSRRWRPLLFATRAKSDKCVRILLDAGANPHCPDVENRSPLHIAATSGKLGILKMLIESNGEVDINARTLDLDDMKIHLRAVDNPRSGSTLSTPGCTALHEAAWHGNLGMVQYLANCPGLDASLPTTDGMTAFHLAAKCGHLEVLKCLTPLRGVHPRQRSSDDRTALHLAAKYQHPDVVKYLTDLDPVSWYVEDEDCLTVDETIAWFCESDDQAERILSIKPATGNRIRTSEECKALLFSTSRRLENRLDGMEEYVKRIRRSLIPKRTNSLSRGRKPNSTGASRRRRSSLPPSQKLTLPEGLTRSRSLTTRAQKNRNTSGDFSVRKVPFYPRSLATMSKTLEVGTARARSKSQSAASPEITNTNDLHRYTACVPTRIWQSRIRQDSKRIWS